MSESDITNMLLTVLWTSTVNIFVPEVSIMAPFYVSDDVGKNIFCAEAGNICQTLD